MVLLIIQKQNHKEGSKINDTWSCLYNKIFDYYPPHIFRVTISSNMYCVNQIG